MNMRMDPSAIGGAPRGPRTRGGRLGPSGCPWRIVRSFAVRRSLPRCLVLRSFYGPSPEPAPFSDRLSGPACAVGSFGVGACPIIATSVVRSAAEREPIAAASAASASLGRSSLGFGPTAAALVAAASIGESTVESSLAFAFPVLLVQTLVQTGKPLAVTSTLETVSDSLLSP